MSQEIAAILAKIKDGDELTDSERELLENHEFAEIGGTPWADSMKQASGLSGIPLEVLKRIKRDGCPAFVNSRVNIQDLNNWVKYHGLEKYRKNLGEKEQFELDLVKERFRKLKLENDEKEGVVISREDVKSVLFAIGKQINAILGRKLENEMPVKWAGREVEELRKEGRLLRDEICREFREGVKEWA